MHEMSIVQGLLDIIEQEMDKHGVNRLISVKVVHGQLTNIVPEALEFAWEALTVDTPHKEAKLTTEEIPLKLRCGSCKKEFIPEEMSALLAPCPDCEEQLGHEVLSGRELFIENIEAE